MDRSFLRVDRVLIVLIIISINIALNLEAQNIIQRTISFLTLDNEPPLSTTRSSLRSSSSLSNGMGDSSSVIKSRMMMRTKFDNDSKNNNNNNNINNTSNSRNFFTGFNESHYKTIQTITLDNIKKMDDIITNHGKNIFCSMPTKKENKPKERILLDIVYNCHELLTKDNDNDDRIGRWTTIVYAMRKQARNNGIDFMLRCSEMNSNNNNENNMMMMTMMDEVMPWLNGYWPASSSASEQEDMNADSIKIVQKTPQQEEEKDMIEFNNGCGLSLLESISQNLPQIQSEFRHMAISIFEHNTEDNNNLIINKDQPQALVPEDSSHYHPIIPQEKISSSSHRAMMELDEVAVHFHCNDWINYNTDDDEEMEDDDESGSSSFDKRFSTLFKTLDLTDVKSIGIVTTDSLLSSSSSSTSSSSFSTIIMRTLEQFNTCQVFHQELKQYFIEKFPRARVTLRGETTSTSTSTSSETFATSIARLVKAERATIVSTSSTIASLAALSSFGTTVLLNNDNNNKGEEDFLIKLHVDSLSDEENMIFL